MSRSIKAALLSALIFPGAGHFLLRQYRRGVFLLLVSLLALSVIVTISTRQALAIVDEINSGQVPANAATITELLENPPDDEGSWQVSVCTIVLGTCWLFGIVDAYRLGRKEQDSVGDR